MNTRRLVPLYCSATLFLTGVAWGQSAAPGADLGVPAQASTQLAADASSASSAPVIAAEPGPALAPPIRRQHTLTPQEQELLQRYDKNGDGKLDAAELDAAHGAAQQAKLSRDVLARQLYDRLLEQYDTAREGRLNADQQKQAVDFIAANRPRVFQALLRQFDRNGDGKLDANETTALFNYFSSLPSDLSATGAGGRAPPTSPSPSLGDPGQPMGAPAALPMAAPDLSASLDAVPASPPPKAKGAKVAGGGGARFYSLLLQKFDHANQGSLTPAEQAEAVAYLASNNPRLYARLLTRFDRNRDGRLDPDETARMFDRLAKAGARPNSSE